MLNRTFIALKLAHKPNFTYSCYFLLVYYVDVLNVLFVLLLMKEC